MSLRETRLKQLFRALTGFGLGAVCLGVIALILKVFPTHYRVFAYSLAFLQLGTFAYLRIHRQLIVDGNKLDAILKWKTSGGALFLTGVAIMIAALCINLHALLQLGAAMALQGMISYCHVFLTEYQMH